jgi:shikimate dehydrogenase
VESVIKNLRIDLIEGINVTVPYKKTVIPFMDQLTPLAKKAGSVNTILKKNNTIIGDNTDIGGFERALKHIEYQVKDKKAFILGAGGVAPSIIVALDKMGIRNIAISNRTISKAESLKKLYPKLEIVEWGKSTSFDIIVNATSLGLKNDDFIKVRIDDTKLQKLYYDVIYNPEKTQFLKKGKDNGNKVENGKMMFIYQAQLSFKIWHGFEPKIDENVINFFKND